MAGSSAVPSSERELAQKFAAGALMHLRVSDGIYLLALDGIAANAAASRIAARVAAVAVLRHLPFAGLALPVQSADEDGR
jgi:hypothetical protein